MVALPSSWQQPEVTNIHAWVCKSSDGEKCDPVPSPNPDLIPQTFYSAVMTYLSGQQKLGDRVVFGEVFAADGSCDPLEDDWAVQNFNGFVASTLRQRAANAGTVFRLWTPAHLNCWGLPSGINPPYDPYR